MNRLRKNIIDFFKQHGFQITIEINLKITDFLDIYIDLENGKFYPCRKPNNTPLYVHGESNHPLNILKQLLKMTSERLSNLSCNEDEFIKASGEYHNVLKNSGLKTNSFTLHVTSVKEGNVTEKLSGTTLLSISKLKRTLAKLFFNYWTEIFHPIIDYIRLSTETL